MRRGEHMTRQGKRKLCLGLLWLAGLVPIEALAATLPQAPPEYAQATPTTRAFLQAAKRAESIRDPLARCLAYPDYPDHAWPAGAAEAYCYFQWEPAVTLDIVRDHLTRGALAELDGRFKADLERHFSKDRFSEIIHRDFNRFDASQASGQVSQQWLALAPQSPYALTARASYFRAMAAKARGGAWAKDTPAENMQRMSEFAERAIDYYQQAIRIEPRLMAAYASLVDTTILSSDHALGEKIFERGMAVDPACKMLTGYRMEALTPRWGGSYPQMLALSARLAPFVQQRPLLALNTIWPQVDLADMTSSQDSYEAALPLIKPLLRQSPHEFVFEESARWMDHVPPVDRWEQLVELLEASRFGNGKVETSLLRGRLLMQQANEPGWAQASLKAAVHDDPDNAYAHYLLAAAYWNAGHPELSEPDYLLAMKDPANRRDALFELVQTRLATRENAKARNYIDQFNKEYPKDGPGWKLRSSVLLAQGIHGDEVTEALRKFVATADRSDLRQMMQVQSTEKLLRDWDAYHATKKAHP